MVTRPVYGSDPFDYDFGAALANSRQRAPKVPWKAALHPDGCGPCDDCREARADYRKIPAYRERAKAATRTVVYGKRSGDVTYGYGRPTKTKPSPATVHEIVYAADGSFTIPTLPVTAESLRKHAQRFGPAGVAEVARRELPPAEAESVAADLDVNRTRQRATTATMKEQVRALRNRGVVAGAIADALNISDRRCRKLLADLSEAA